MRKLVVGLAAIGTATGRLRFGSVRTAGSATTGSHAASTVGHHGQRQGAGALRGLAGQPDGDTTSDRRSTSATGGTFEGTGAGSTQLVQEIKGKVKQADVFISASTDANTGLMGAANGDWETLVRDVRHGPAADRLQPATASS